MFDGQAWLLTDSTVSPMPLQMFSGEFLQWAVVFFVLAILAALVGARGVAGVSMTVAKWFVIIFIVLTVITLVL
jgi:uncharacterized membrane protein YtjA (UPF0391 family)